jgi:WD40 repeat protein
MVEASVRCLVWFGETHVLIGCLDGRVVRWRVGEEEAVEEVCRMEGSVIIMRWNQDKTLLAVGSSTGVLTICSALETNCGLVPETSFTAHPPQLGNKDMRFGQLSKQAEIWSLCWSPSSNQIATCSEDQTTKIWNVRNWSCQATLRGHTMAVTGVDWKQSDFCGSILATCSDDRVSYSSVKSYRYCEFDTTVFALPTVTYL